MKLDPIKSVLVFVAVCVYTTWSPFSFSLTNSSESAASLTAKYNSLKINKKFIANDYGDEFLVTSSLINGNARGEVYAKLDYPIDHIRTLLQSLPKWCEAANLHINVHKCAADPEYNSIEMTIGKEGIFSFSSLFTFNYTIHYIQMRPDYFKVNFDAQNGPLDTSDYNLVFEAVKLNESTSFIHLIYANHFGFISRAMLTTYLNTLGRDKVGFSYAIDNNTPTSHFIQGIEGIMERNVVRYLFAIQAYIECMQYPTDQQFSQGVRRWYTITQKYPKQLFEISLEEFLEQKLQQ